MKTNPWKAIAIALAGVVVIALVAVAFFLGQSRAGQQADPPPTATSTAPSALPATISPSNNPSAPTGDAIPRGSVVAGGGGVPVGPGGLHLRYPHTTDGAVAAATNYLTAMYSVQFRTDQAYRDQLAKTLASTPEMEAQMRDAFNTWAQLVGPGEGGSYAERGAYAIASKGDDQMKVILWGPVCGPDRCSWSMQAVVLVWEQEDWKPYVPGVSSEARAGDVDPADPRGVPKPDEKYRILKYPFKLGDQGKLAEAYKLPWMEYENAAR